MTNTELIDASRIDYAAYASFQKEAYKDLLARAGSSDAHMTPEYYRWKYHTPAGEGRIARITEDGKIVSSSAMIPLRLRVNNTSLLGWHCLDVATLPQARGKGFFLSTLKTLKNSIGNNEVFFAFPNASSIPSFLKLHCKENVLLTTWINPLLNFRKHSCRQVKEIKKFCPEHDIFIDQRIHNEGPVLEHNSDYLNWRYVRHPNNKYVYFSFEQNKQCAGFAVARRARVLGKNLALVMELWGANRSIEVALLRHIAWWASNHGEKMAAMMNTSMSFYHALLSNFFPVPSFLLPKRQVLVVDTKSPEQELFLNKKWKIQTGDWDVF